MARSVHLRPALAGGLLGERHGFDVWIPAWHEWQPRNCPESDGRVAGGSRSEHSSGLPCWMLARPANCASRTDPLALHQR